MSKHRIYLDNAATSWPKPEAVYTAMDRYMRENGAPAGRSIYSQAVEVDAAIAAARTSIASLIGVGDAKQIIFTSNGTEALNLAIHGLLRPGDHVVCTAADHNSVLRPLRYLEIHGQVTVTRVPVNSSGLVEPGEISKVLRANTRLVVMTHASNVTGIIQPVAEVGLLVQKHGALFLVDIAQTLGHIELSVEELHADLLACPGHKGLLGPLGTGLLYIRLGLEKELHPLRQGGTGTRSDDDHQPNSMPAKFESGNHNVPGLIGLAAALRWIEARGIANIKQQEQQLAAQLRAGLRQIPHVVVHCHAANKKLVASENEAAYAPCSVGVVSISCEGYDPQEAAAALEANFGLQVRAGLHCAPLMHEALGTLQHGGTVRFSIGPFNNSKEIEAAIWSVAKLTTAL